MPSSFEFTLAGFSITFIRIICISSSVCMTVKVDLVTQVRCSMSTVKVHVKFLLQYVTVMYNAI